MAIAPYNYANPQATAVGTGSAKIAPFTYATPTVATPQKPSIASVAGNSLVGGIKQIGGVFKDDTSQILDAFKSSFNLGVQSVDKITDPKGGTPYEGLQAGLGLAEGVGGVVFSPLAPITNQIIKLITAAGNKLADTPYLQGYGKDVVEIPEVQSANDTTSKILQTAAGFGNVAMGILGAKGLGAEVPKIEAPTKLPVISHSVETPIEVNKLAPVVPHETPVSAQKVGTSAPFGGDYKITKTEAKNSLGNLTGKQVFQVSKDGSVAEFSTEAEAKQFIASRSPSLPKELEPLAAEARKYKTAEEFIHGLTYYGRIAPTEAIKEYRAKGGKDIDLTDFFHRVKDTSEPTFAEKPVTRTTQTLKPVEGTGDLKTRGLSQGVEAGAIEKQLTDHFGDLPEYKQVSMKEQAQVAFDLIAKDPAAARAIALGEKAPPKGLLPESVFVAAERDATLKGDVQTLKDLANSKLAGSATTMGQRIRTLGERDQHSAIAAIQEVQAARAAKLAGKESAPAIVNRIKSTINKGHTKETWGSFIKSIEC